VQKKSIKFSQIFVILALTFTNISDMIISTKENKKPIPQSLPSNHGTGTNQKNERMPLL
jgi:hypothetical protein